MFMKSLRSFVVCFEPKSNSVVWLGKHFNFKTFRASAARAFVNVLFTDFNRRRSECKVLQFKFYDFKDEEVNDDFTKLKFSFLSVFFFLRADAQNNSLRPSASHFVFPRKTS